MDILTAIVIASATVYLILVGCVLVFFTNIFPTLFKFFAWLFHRVVDRRPSYYRPPRFNPSDLEVQSLSDGPSPPAQAYLANDRITTTNAARRRLQKFTIPISLSITSFKKFSDKALAYPQKAFEHFRHKLEPSGGSDTATISSFVGDVVALGGYSPPGSPVEFRSLDDDGAESISTLSGCTLSNVPVEEDPAADDASGVHPFFSNDPLSVVSLSPTMVNPGVGPAWA